jgi:hypothetical protein
MRVPNTKTDSYWQALEVRKAKAVAKKPVKAPVKAKPVAVWDISWYFLFSFSSKAIT